ncbi:MAG: hypothetical protein Q8N61_00615, partial [bacterium]|nr:hypothetical protein [bacterium]
MNELNQINNPWLQTLISIWDQIVDVFDVYISRVLGISVYAASGTSRAAKRRWVRMVALIMAITVTGSMLLSVILLPLAFLVTWWGYPALGNLFLLGEIFFTVIAFLLLGMVGQALKTAFLTIKLAKNLTIDAPIKITTNLAAYLASVIGVSFGAASWALKTAMAGLPWDNTKEMADIKGLEWKQPETMNILEEAEKTWADGFGEQVTSLTNLVTGFFLAMLWLGIIPLCLNVYLGFGGHGETGQWLNHFGTLFGVTVIVIVMAISLARSRNYRRIAVASVVIVSFGLAGIVTQYYTGALAKYSVLTEQRRARQQTELNDEQAKLEVVRSTYEAVVLPKQAFTYEVYRHGNTWKIKLDPMGNPVKSFLLLAAGYTIAYTPDEKGGMYLTRNGMGQPYAVCRLIGLDGN